MRRGLPYSVREAKLVVARLQMNEYVRDILRYLIRKVERLEREAKK